MSRNRQFIMLVVIALLYVSVNAIDCQEYSSCMTCGLNLSQKPICITCREGYILQNDECVYDANSCLLLSGTNCSIPYCIKQSFHIYQSPQVFCLLCAYPYSMIYGGQCSFYCSYTGTYTTDLSTCKPYCNMTGCDICTSNYSSTCSKCQNGYFLLNDTCVSECPVNYFIQISNKCIACPVNCRQCDSLLNCTSCIAQDLTTPPSCSCPVDTFFSTMIQQCTNQCEFLYLPSQSGICQRVCPDQQYPSVYDYVNNAFICQGVTSTQNDYCVQHIKNVKNFMKVTFQSQSTDVFQMTAYFAQTPSACYSYSMFGLDTFQFQQQASSQSTDYTIISFIVNRSDVENKNQVKCDLQSCSLNIRLQWGNQIQYIFKVNISLTLTGVISNQVTYNGNLQQIDIACENCTIPKELIINSTVTLNCAANQICNDNQITAVINTPVVVTQFISDSNYKTSFIQPHSLKFDYTDSSTGATASIYLQNYSYTNNIAGQITYTFVAIGIANGKLTITSSINSVKITRFLATSGAPTYMYPQLILDLQISSQTQNKQQLQEQEPNTSQSTSSPLLTIIISCISFIIGIAAFCAYQKFRNKKQSLAKETKANVQADSLMKVTVNKDCSNELCMQQQVVLNHQVQDNQVKLEDVNVVAQVDIQIEKSPEIGIQNNNLPSQPQDGICCEDNHEESDKKSVIIRKEEINNGELADIHEGIIVIEDLSDDDDDDE